METKKKWDGEKIVEVEQEVELTEKNKKLYEELADKSGVNVNNTYFNVFLENCLIREIERLEQEDSE